MVMTEPAEALKKYVATHYSVDVPIGNHTEGCYVDMVISCNPEIKLRLLLSRIASTGARPVLESVRANETLMWHFKRDYAPTVPYGEQHIVHLYRYQGQWFQVYVRLGAELKQHEVFRVSRFDGRDLPCLHSVLLRQKIAREWGCKTIPPNTAEKKALQALKPS